ncbi:ArnT family glycosyltransferase [Nocardia vaccinii]|uniref:ArnT family glycosyltransferase n=1 Tax=Nocardia vaccinii TaxID=1822 RepID=UPI00083330FB|nr:glycosyltransferase family 39 protein [Nocardia vaccinii]
MTDTAIAPSVPSRLPARPGRRLPRREDLAVALLLIGTAVAYLWNLGVNGWANSFYAAAVQSGAHSWKAFFFGSSDWGNSITVDKTPASLWPMEISARLFGMHPWSMMLPQALLGIASVALLWATLRRTHGSAAGVLGGLALAATPVAALMLRFDNPDTLLVFLMLAAVWAMTRALEDGRWRWLVLCGAFVGFGFLAKQLQVLLVLPALGVTYLIAGPPRVLTRLLQLCAAGAAMIAGAGWWVLVAQLWPASSRPYFGGSEHNSIIELTLGYNGLGRLGVGSSSSPVPGPPGGHQPKGGFFGSSPGITRMFQETVGGQIAWLIPAAIVLLVAGILLRGKVSRTDPQRAALLLWGGWMLVTGLVFSFMRGIFHQYYTVALAPAVAGTVGLGAVMAWRARDRMWVRFAAASAVALSTAAAILLLSRTPDFVPWLRWAVLVVGVAATVALLIPRPHAVAVAAAVAAVLTALAGPVAYSLQTIGTAHSGGIVLAGPRTQFGDFPFGPPPIPDEPERGASTPGQRNGHGAPADAQTPANRTGRGHQGPFGGPPDPALIAKLRDGGPNHTWTAASVGSMTSSDLQLASGYPVMPVGGFAGGDPSPTLRQFQDYVSHGRIHYFIGRPEGMRGPGSRDRTSTASQITRWVEQHYTATAIGGLPVYDLTAPQHAAR